MERRQAKRKRGIEGTVTVRKGWLRLFSKSDETHYQLIDIGVEGMCILCRDAPSAPKVGDNVSFRVRAHKVLPFETTGRVTWVKPWSDGKRVVLGVRFGKLDADARAAVGKLFISSPYHRSDPPAP